VSYPDLRTVAYRVPRGIVRCVSAAAVHDLTDEIPPTATGRGAEAEPPAGGSRSPWPRCSGSVSGRLSLACWRSPAGA